MRRGRRRLERRAAICALVACASLLAGCGSDGSPQHVGAGSTTTAPENTTTADPALLGPGTKLADGFKVAEGSLLVGATLPGVEYDVEAEKDSQVAVLVIDGDAGAVFDAYVREATERGYALTSSSDRSPCRLADESDALVAGAAKGLKASIASQPIFCTAYGSSATTMFSLELATTGPGDDAPWAGTVILEWRPDPTPTATPTTEATIGAGLLIGDRADLLPDPGTRPAAPAAGERLAPAGESDGGMGPRLPGMVVPAGTEALAPAAPHSYPGAWTAVLRTERDPKPVVEELLGDEHDAAAGPTFDGEVDGRRIVHGSWDEAGGDKLYVTAVADGDGWLTLVEATTDW